MKLDLYLGENRLKNTPSTIKHILHNSIDHFLNDNFITNDEIIFEYELLITEIFRLIGSTKRKKCVFVKILTNRFFNKDLKLVGYDVDSSCRM